MPNAPAGVIIMADAGNAAHCSGGVRQSATLTLFRKPERISAPFSQGRRPNERAAEAGFEFIRAQEDRRAIYRREAV